MGIVKYKNPKTGITYCYESTPKWDPEKGQARPTRTYLGRWDEETQSIIACGAGSVTKLLDPATDRIERIFDMKYPQEYLDRFDEMLSRKQTIREFYEENGI